MDDPDFDKLMRVEFGPYDEQAARRAVESFVSLFLSVRRNRRARAAGVPAGDDPGKSREKPLTRREGKATM